MTNPPKLKNKIGQYTNDCPHFFLPILLQRKMKSTLAPIFLTRKERLTNLLYFRFQYIVSFISMSIGPCVVKKFLIFDVMRICHEVLSNGK